MRWPRAATLPLSVAPMMDRTDRHFRWVLRQITRHTLLYTELVTSQAVLRGPRQRLLAYDAVEHPLSLQLGGDHAGQLAECAHIAEDLGFDEVNLNVGCPSDRVQKGCFGAVLMKRPHLVADLVEAMRAAVSIPVTVKHRVGVDDLDDFSDLLHFVDVVAQAGADRFTVHARKAWLKGLSPKENRTVPPLRYADVWQLKTQRPHLPIEINGGVSTLDQAFDQLQHVDAVMIGRGAYDNPWSLIDADRRLFCGSGLGLATTQHELVERVADYAHQQLAEGQRLGPIARHLLGLFSGQPGARAWRRHLSTHAFVEGAGPSVLIDALAALDQAAERVAAR